MAISILQLSNEFIHIGIDPQGCGVSLWRRSVFVILKRLAYSYQGTRTSERRSRGLAARSAESMSGLHERRAGRKEGSEQKRWKEEAFVRGTERGEEREKRMERRATERGQNGRVEWGGRKGNKSADTIAFLDEIQTCNSSKGRRGEERELLSLEKACPRLGEAEGEREKRRGAEMVYTEVAEAKATRACNGVLKVMV